MSLGNFRKRVMGAKPTVAPQRRHYLAVKVARPTVARALRPLVSTLISLFAVLLLLPVESAVAVPCAGIGICSIVASPSSAPTGSGVSLVVTFQDPLGNPFVNTLLEFSVIGGPDLGIPAAVSPISELTDSQGRASFDLRNISGNPGIDIVEATALNSPLSPQAVTFEGSVTFV